MPEIKQPLEIDSTFQTAETDIESCDLAADHILAALEHLRELAQGSGQPAMAGAINRAFETCLSVHVCAKAAELSARIGASSPDSDLPAL